MRLGIICATPEEFEALRPSLSIRPSPTSHAGFEFWSGGVGDQDLVLVRSGIGKVNAALVTTILLESHHCSHIIFSGVAGGLDPALTSGDVILGQRVAAHDYGIMTKGRFTSILEGTFPIGVPALSVDQIPSASQKVIYDLPAVAQEASSILNRQVRLGTILTGDYFVNCGMTRARLRGQLEGDAVDMESSAVFSVAQRYGRDAYIIRTISDNADEASHVSYLELVTMAAENSAVCVTHMLTQI